MFKESLIGARNEFEQIKASCIISDVFGVMEIMISCAVDEGQSSCRRPGQIVPAVAFNAVVELVDLEHEKGEDVHLVENEDQRTRKLHYY